MSTKKKPAAPVKNPASIKSMPGSEVTKKTSPVRERMAKDLKNKQHAR